MFNYVLQANTEDINKPDAKCSMMFNRKIQKISIKPDATYLVKPASASSRVNKCPG